MMDDMMNSRVAGKLPSVERAFGSRPVWPEGTFRRGGKNRVRFTIYSYCNVPTGVGPLPYQGARLHG